MHLNELVALGIGLVPLACHAHRITEGRSFGSFGQPAARVRPRFRYWLPDASVPPETVKADIESSGALGAGGVELLPFYNYGGGTPVVDWVKYGFGTEAFNEVFRGALEAHRDSGLVMDFAMGPNQGQGVPAETDNPGLQWDLRTHTANASLGETFDEVVPGWGSGDLVAVVSALVLSEEDESIPPRAGQGPPYNYTKLTLQQDTLVDHTSSVTPNTGRLSIEIPSAGPSGSHYRVFAFYETLTLAKNLDPVTNATATIFDNGSFLVDHFDARGAHVVTDFWDEYILPDGIRELLAQVGSSGWEDSMELLSNVSWSPSLPSRFEKRFGYSIEPFLPLIIFGNNNINIESAEPGLIRCVLDTEDEGQGYVNDYRAALQDGYAEYLGVFTNWTQSALGLTHSSQVSYNLPMDMEASIPLEDVPECESLQARDNVDSYRQFSGSAYLSDKQVLSIELGAVFGDAYTYTIPHLLWAMNRAASGGVNQFIIHGQQYSGRYPNTTWPGYVSFGYHVSDQYSDKQPSWENGLEGALRYMGRIGWVQQQGVPRLDVAFYNKQSATDPIVQTLYEPDDLENEGWTYAYISPANFGLPQARVAGGLFAPDGPAFQAMVVESDQNMTMTGIEALIDYASSGLPIILSGGSPGYFPSGNTSDQDLVAGKIATLEASSSVFKVDKGQAASQLEGLGLKPRVSVQTSGRWYPSWREDENTGIDYAYVFCDTNSSSGAITVRSTRRPFLLDAWTGDITPLVIYDQSVDHTTIPLTMAGNETVVIAFADGSLSDYPNAPSLHVVNVTSPLLGSRYGHGGCIELHVDASTPSSQALLSNGSTIGIDGSDVPGPMDLTSWSLTAEHWDAPLDFNDSSIVAHKYNTTIELDRLVSWLELPSLANVSGIGYYTTNFTWPPRSLADLSFDSESLGAYISLTNVLDAVTVYINGKRLPPLDYNHAEADISGYLETGSNTVLAVVPTTMWNYIQTVLPEIVNAGETVQFSGGPFGSPSAPSDNGLVGSVKILPYHRVEIA